jgi:hypothetical protein
LYYENAHRASPVPLGGTALFVTQSAVRSYAYHPFSTAESRLNNYEDRNRLWFLDENMANNIDTEKSRKISSNGMAIVEMAHQMKRTEDNISGYTMLFHRLTDIIPENDKPYLRKKDQGNSG